MKTTPHLTLFILLLFGSASATTISACGFLNVDNTSFVLNQSITVNGATCITFNGTNQSLNCNGYTITGNNTSGTYGIYSNKSWTNISNCNVSGFQYGVFYTGLDGGSMSNVNASANSPQPECSIRGDDTTCSQYGCTSILPHCFTNGVTCVSQMTQEACDGWFGSCTWFEGMECIQSVDWCEVRENEGDCVGEGTCGWFPFNCTGTGYGCGIIENCKSLSVVSSTNCALDKVGSWGEPVGLSLTSSNRTTVTNSNLFSNGSYSTILNAGGNHSFNNTSFISTAAQYNYAGVAGSAGIYSTTSSGNNFTNVTFGTATSNGFTLTSSHNARVVRPIITAGNTTYDSGIYNTGGTDLYIDCEGGNMTGKNKSQSWGAYSLGARSTILNCRIQNFSMAVYLNTAADSRIDNVNASSTYNLDTTTDGSAFLIYANSHRTNITNSNGTARAGRGLYVYDVKNMTVNNSPFSGGDYAIYDRCTSGTSGGNNTFINSTTNSGTYGIYLTCVGDTVDGGTANRGDALIGASWTTYKNRQAISQLFLDNCPNCTVLNNNITISGTYALRVYRASDVNVTNNIIANTLSGATRTGLSLYDASKRGIYKNNTISAVLGNAIKIEGNLQAGNNTFYWNNVSGTGLYVNDSNGTNNYNSTLGGANEGNAWANVMNGSVQISGLTYSLGYPVLYVGTSGSGYPYNNSTSGGKFLCNFAGCGDYAPLTPTQSSTNTAPLITNISIIPSTPTKAGNMSFNIKVTDAEQSTINISGYWYKNGINQSSLAFAFNGLANNTSTLVSNLTSGNFTKGQNWSIQAVAFDGTNYSSLNMSANITIANSPPTIIQNITFVNATQTSSFTANATVEDLDGATDIINTSCQTSSGTCSYLSNSTSSNNFTVQYNFTGTGLSSASVNITFYDSSGASVTTPNRNNTYPFNTVNGSLVQTPATTGNIVKWQINITVNGTGVATYVIPLFAVQNNTTIVDSTLNAVTNNGNYTDISWNANYSASPYLLTFYTEPIIQSPDELVSYAGIAGTVQKRILLSSKFMQNINLTFSYTPPQGAYSIRFYRCAASTNISCIISGYDNLAFTFSGTTITKTLQLVTNETVVIISWDTAIGGGGGGSPPTIISNNTTSNITASTRTDGPASQPPFSTQQIMLAGSIIGSIIYGIAFRAKMGAQGS